MLNVWVGILRSWYLLKTVGERLLINIDFWYIGVYELWNSWKIGVLLWSMNCDQLLKIAGCCGEN